MSNKAKYWTFFYKEERSSQQTVTAIKLCKSPSMTKEYKELKKRLATMKVHCIGYEVNDRANELHAIELNAMKQEVVTYWRNPTPYEIIRGYGAIHYRDFKRSECSKEDNTLKKWFIADDGLRYNY